MRESNADKKMYEKSSQRLADARKAREMSTESAAERRLAVEDAKAARQEREHKTRLRSGYQPTYRSVELSDAERSDDTGGDSFMGDSRPTSTCPTCFTVRSPLEVSKGICDNCLS